jgi:hypothetical protein
MEKNYLFFKAKKVPKMGVFVDGDPTDYFLNKKNQRCFITIPNLNFYRQLEKS